MQWWCSRDSDSSRWIELFALLKIVERRRSWWGWWLNLLSSYSGSFVSRWRRLQARLLCLSLSLSFSRAPTLYLSPPISSFFLSFFLSLFLILSFSRLASSANSGSTRNQRGPKRPPNIYVTAKSKRAETLTVCRRRSPRYVQMLEIFAFRIRESKRRPIATS